MYPKQISREQQHECIGIVSKQVVDADNFARNVDAACSSGCGSREGGRAAVFATRRFASTSERPPVCSWCLSGSVLQGSWLMVAALNGVPVFGFVVHCSTFGFDVPVRLGAC